MGFLLSRQQIQNFRIFILNGDVEHLLLIMYLVSFAWLISIKMRTLDGSQLQNEALNKMTLYGYNNDLTHYFEKDEFYKIDSIDGIYEYVEKITNEKLWSPEDRSPNWPIGSLRLIQQRVEIPKDCRKGPSVKKEETLVQVYSYQCSPLFSSDFISTQGKDQTKQPGAAQLSGLVKDEAEKDVEKQLLTDC